MKISKWAIGILPLLMLAAGPAQEEDIHLETKAQGNGTLIMNGNDEYKVSGVLVVLRKNGDAQFTLFTDLQVYGQGRWSAGEDVSSGIDLKITGGLVKGGAKGVGKLFLRADNTSIAKLTMQGTGSGGSKFEVTFLAEEKKDEPN